MNGEQMQTKVEGLNCETSAAPVQSIVHPFFEQDGITIYHGRCEEVLPRLNTRMMTMISDPPYGIDAVLGMGGGIKGDGGMWKGVAIQGDGDTTIRDWACEQFESWAVFGSPRRASPPNTKAVVCWDKGEHTGAGDLRLPWKPSFELVFISGDDWRHDRRCGGVVKCNAIAGCVGNRNSGHRYHPFEKPVQIMRHFVERCSRAVCDPFCGSGTTLVAAKLAGRSAVGIEIEERYCELAVDRLRQGVLPFVG